ncbi:MAG: hypothetical protein KJZ72_19250 [Anaerolineales bacterium]|nr:hypothetical protein [Anaerolineales bacterium]
MKKIMLMIVVLALSLTACAPVATTPNAQQLDEIVQATFTALTAQAPTAPPAVTTGSISGNLSFPSEGIPPLLVVAFNSETGQYYWVQTVQDQTTYQIDDLPVGSYTVFAYALPDGKMVGAYDQFYVCGLHQGCNDLSLIEVEVQAGVVTPNIDPGDWYGDPTQWPSMPNDPSIPNLEVGDETAENGGIAGQLSYPSSFIPAMMVVAFEANSESYYYILTNENSSAYQIDNLPPGTYFVVAYPGGDSSYPGAYSQAVPCGLLATCTDHSLIPVEVKSGEVTQGINPGDFYAPPGTFPSAPLR